MGNGYDHHSIQHHHHHHQQKTIFLPIFCRLSTKDINLNNHYKINPKPSDEPSSPKVSCIGQVKIRNNRVIGYPTTTSIAAANNHKYTKLKKLFSSKTLLLNTAAGKNGSRSCRNSREMCTTFNNSRKLRVKNDICRNNDDDQDCAVKVVNIGEMDPPLPVVKRVAPPGVGRDEVNIWKRRFNGPGLKSLQIEQIHLPNPTKFQPPTTV
ncbi:hypothetical protein BUALT_Bualt08G0126400 [Buddleja alternifolia]|uniref:Uncharacterized protein n=1 Tax=Buddleja alternifolia TaxID=168488 RepID=A0AAV6XE60_9LAMI|nr:hypothetical protein BUALT_Bualt08G0126400 [Buddleja alternifolia]